MKPNLTPSLETFTKPHHEMKSITRLVRIVAVGLFLSAIALIGAAWAEFVNTPSLGIDIDFGSGTILQVFITNPNADVFSYEDRIISIDGIPIDQLTFDYFGDLHRSYVFELMRPDGATRFETVSVYPANRAITAERLAIPLLGLIPVLIGVLLVFRKQPDRTTQYLLAFLYLFGVNIISGQLNRLEGGWVSAVFYLSSLLSGWAFVEFHWRFLEAKPHRLLLWLFRGMKLLFVITFLLALQGILPVFEARLLFWNSIDLLIVFVIITTLFIRQATQNALHRGILRTMFLSMVMAFMPIIVFSYFPLLFNQPFAAPAIIVTLPVLLIPVNYFLLYLQQKNWIKLSIGFLSGVTAFMLMHLIVRLVYLFIPQTLSDYRFLSSNWVNYLISILSMLTYLALFHAAHKIALLIIYGNVRHSTQKMQQTGQNVLHENDTDAALLRMGKVFLQEFYRFRYLNICLRNGTVLQYDENYQLVLVNYDPATIESLIQTLAQGHEEADRQSLTDRMVAIDQIQPHLGQFPQIFGDKPKHCYLLLGTQGVIGFIVAGERRGSEPFDLMETRQLVLLLNQFQILIENILLLETVQNTSQQMRLSGQRMLQMRENERKRIARDMHDNIIQAITGFRYQLNELYDADLLAISDEEADELQHSLMTITQDIRDICFNLRPPALDATGLQSAVVSLVESYHAREALVIDVQIIGEDIVDKLSDEIAICLYRVLQETLFNAYQHSRSREVLVVLSAQEDIVRLVVKDSGVGFTVPDQINQLVSGGHFGLLGAQEFLEVVNGEFRVFSEPGKGATIEAIIPLVTEVGEHGVFYDYCR
jgi:signal transduction histidine kinase